MVFRYLISIFKLLQNIAVRIFFNSPVANNQPLYIILLAHQHCWLPTINKMCQHCWLPNIDVYIYYNDIYIYRVFTLEHMFQISIYIVSHIFLY